MVRLSSTWYSPSHQTHLELELTHVMKTRLWLYLNWKGTSVNRHLCMQAAHLVHIVCLGIRAWPRETHINKTYLCAFQNRTRENRRMRTWNAWYRLQTLPSSLLVQTTHPDYRPCPLLSWYRLQTLPSSLLVQTTDPALFSPKYRYTQVLVT